MNAPGSPPCVLFEDDHLLVVNKPSGWNTHSPSPYAGEGIFDWLRDREPRWANLAIIHRLDKETSGVLAFAKTTAANRSLTRQFTERQVCKRYLLVTDRPVPPGPHTVSSHLAKVGNRYRSQRAGDGGIAAETTFRRLEQHADRTLVEAVPATGRTHQIRIHAADAGFPILGDALYGGTEAARLHLHAAELTLHHPLTEQPVSFCAPVDWQTDPSSALRESFISPTDTDAFRLVHGAADRWPGWYVEHVGRCLLSQSEAPLTAAQETELLRLERQTAAMGVYHKRRERRVREAGAGEIAPHLLRGEGKPAEVVVRENGLRFALRFSEGYSVGLFLDQRDNRRRLLTGHIARDFPVFPGGGNGREVLNLFAYTCAFSVCAAQAGARVTSIDLSRKYLEWGQRNFTLNDLDPAGHEFIYGDAFDWLRRFARKRRWYDAVLIDPPTFSTSKQGGHFRAETDWPRLAAAALSVLKPDGLLFASTNAVRLTPERFVAQLNEALTRAGRVVRRQHYAPQPPDFPVTREEPAYLKTLWLASSSAPRQ